MSTDSLRIRRIATTDADFEKRLHAMLDRNLLLADEVTVAVRDILAAVRARGDAALLDYTRKFDGFDVASMDELTVERPAMELALQRLPESRRKALDHAATRIRRYHQRQKQSSWHYQESDGSVYGQKITPLQRVGIYVPGGKASYPSSVLMLALPAQVAGVEEIIATVPTSPTQPDQLVLAAAALAGVSRLYTIGGAQAVAALAWGTEHVPRVDKITGPGNVYVTAAKKQVFGEVGIDMVAGPTELTIISDGSANPDWIAMDMFSQAEHDELAQSILISTDAAFLDRVQASIGRLLPTMERRTIIEASLRNRGFFVLVQDLEQAAATANVIAPEHLEIALDDSAPVLERVMHAGAIFLGHYSAEALGDYCAGPSHVLPTSGTARFFSALGVYDFQKRSSIIDCSPAGARQLAVTAAELARNESLPAHALAAQYRLDTEPESKG